MAAPSEPDAPEEESRKLFCGTEDRTFAFGGGLLVRPSALLHLEAFGSLYLHSGAQNFLWISLGVLWKAEVGGSPEVRYSRLAWPTWQNPVSTKNTNISRAWWWNNSPERPWGREKAFLAINISNPPRNQ
ncbi:putative uncharacterized protein C8orf44 [Plecturocebus cupreus]